MKHFLTSLLCCAALLAQGQSVPENNYIAMYDSVRAQLKKTIERYNARYHESDTLPAILIACDTTEQTDTTLPGWQIYSEADNIGHEYFQIDTTYRKYYDNSIFWIKGYVIRDGYLDGLKKRLKLFVITYREIEK